MNHLHTASNTIVSPLTNRIKKKKKKVLAYMHDREGLE